MQSKYEAMFDRYTVATLGVSLLVWLLVEIIGTIMMVMDGDATSVVAWIISALFMAIFATMAAGLTREFMGWVMFKFEQRVAEIADERRRVL